MPPPVVRRFSTPNNRCYHTFCQVASARTPCSRPDLVDELHLLPYPLTLGGGKRLLPTDVHATFALQSLCPYPTDVVGLHYPRRR